MWLPRPRPGVDQCLPTFCCYHSHLIKIFARPNKTRKNLFETMLRCGWPGLNASNSFSHLIEWPEPRCCCRFNCWLHFELNSIDKFCLSRLIYVFHWITISCARLLFCVIKFAHCIYICFSMNMIIIIIIHQ